VINVHSSKDSQRGRPIVAQISEVGSDSFVFGLTSPSLESEASQKSETLA
jgi:hypothetical protein